MLIFTGCHRGRKRLCMYEEGFVIFLSCGGCCCSVRWPWFQIGGLITPPLQDWLSPPLCTNLLLKDAFLAFEPLSTTDKHKGRLSHIILCLRNSIHCVKKIRWGGVRCPRALQRHPDQCLCSCFTWEHLSAAWRSAVVNPESGVLILQEDVSRELGS